MEIADSLVIVRVLEEAGRPASAGRSSGERAPMTSVMPAPREATLHCASPADRCRHKKGRGIAAAQVLQILRLPVLAPARERAFQVWRTKSWSTQAQLPVTVRLLETLCCCDPSADLALAPGHANAAPLAVAKTTAAAMLSNRLDIGSPPFP